MHQLWSYSTHLLVREVYNLMLTLCVLVLLIPGWVIQVPDISILCHWAWVLWWSCCTIWPLSTPSSARIWCHCSLFHSSLNYSSSSYATFLSSTQHCFTSSLTYKQKVPLNHPIPVNALLYSSWILCVVSALTVLSTSVIDSAVKKSISCLI